MAAATGARIPRGGGHSKPAGTLPHFIAHLVRAAVAAPPVRGPQPWRLRYSPARGAIEFYADPERALLFGDPHGRSVHIGCGAALFNLRLAAARMGREPAVHLLPRPDEPMLLAAVRLGGAHRPTMSERELYAAMPRRGTGVQPFANRAVPGAVLAELAEAARIEGAVLHLLHPGEAQRVLRLAAGASPPGPPARQRGPGPADGRARSTEFEREPRMAVLTTQFRARADWLRAGQALQRVLLLATGRGVCARPLSHPMDVPDAWLVRDPGAGVEQPQAILQLGYGPIVTPAQRHAISVGPAGPATEPAAPPQRLRARR